MTDGGGNGHAARLAVAKLLVVRFAAFAAHLAERLVRLPLLLAGVCLVALLVDGGDRGAAHHVARLALRLLLFSYLAAGLLNAPRFPRALRGPAMRAGADVWLLDLWTLIALVVARAAILEGTIHGLL